MSQSPIRLRLGTRGSKLALEQAQTVRALLEKDSALACELVILKTTGDRIQDRPLADSGGKGLFTKELEEALLRSDIDLAVHSMKDVPTLFPTGLVIAAILPREDPRDAFISTRAPTLKELPRGARVGTSSVRRQALVARARPDLELVLLRGNVDTRLRKVEAGEYDAIILALAGLRRLGLANRATSLMDTRDWLPALGQGAIGIEIRENDDRTREEVARLDHVATATALACERAFQSALDGTCRTPVGGLARVEGSNLSFRGEVLAPDGSDSVETGFELPLGADPKGDAERAGREAGDALKPRASRWLGL
jgi:hydroxymethylbilane synthase